MKKKKAKYIGISYIYISDVLVGIENSYIENLYVEWGQWKLNYDLDLLLGLYWSMDTSDSDCHQTLLF